MAAKNVKFPVTESTTLLPFLLEHVKGSRNNIKNLLAHGQAAVDGEITTQFDHPLAPGQAVTVLAAPPAATKLPFPALYEDEQLIVINKPAGLLSIANDEEKTDTAYRHVTDYIRAKDPARRIFVVHRLDRDTSGVLLFAKDAQMKNALQEKWEKLVIRRGYTAVTEGVPAESEGTVRSFLRETKGHMVFSGRGTDGKEAVTNYKVRLQNGRYALLDVDIDTGRKNQIRVHMKDLGCPIAGDKKYDAQTNPLRRLGLHASELRFRHPYTGKEVAFIAPEPTSFRALCRR
ncbi:MAG: RluA family pseudouridine synthase [Clostridia bacterium]|nr:RluA family pseudouridine synthase [Clostridia bacterium]